MFKLTSTTLAVGTALSTFGTYAGTVTGSVLDQNNQPVKNATVHYHGKANSVKTDAQGQFTIETDAAGQLHISKDNFTDKSITISGNDENVSVQLDRTAIETVVVYASGLDKNSLEMASAVSVLSGDQLQDNAQPTLGETLKTLPGVNSSYFGPVSSSPVIRGLDGPRVKITQNGLDASDASRIGPDHATSVESLSAEQIEVLRGPATLLYGSGAIGGVVNVVDNRIPTSAVDDYQGRAQYSHDTVSNTNTYAGVFEAGHDGFNVHVDAVTREGDDYETPTFFTEHEGELEEQDSVENTFIDSTTINIGSSYVADHWTFGLAYGRIETDYGIPAHEHHHHEDEDHDHEHEHEEDHEEHHDEEHEAHDEHEEDHNVYARLRQDRWQGLFTYSFHDSFLETLSVRAGYTEYEHSEIEEGEVGTTFINDTTEMRANLKHRFGNWHGTLGYHYSDSDYVADGEEAFTPANDTKTHALYVLEERQFDNWLLELGARVESYELSSVIEEHDHDHDHDHEEHDEHEEHEEHGEYYEYDDTNISASIGATWDVTAGHKLAVSVSHSERSPLGSELLSNGLHIATGSYELGLGYEIEDGEAHFHPEDINQEVSTNFDISWRKYSGDFGFNISAFYNDVKDYYFQQDTGLVFDHDMGFIDASLADEDAAPVYQFQSEDAHLYGLELDVHYRVNNSMTLKAFGDTVTAKLDNDDYLPRIPQAKLGAQAQYDWHNWTFTLTGTHYFEQSDITAYETSTDDYTMYDIKADYNFNIGQADALFFMQVNNLTDELGYVHSSFIKDEAPLPGRNFRLGVRTYF